MKRHFRTTHFWFSVLVAFSIGLGVFIVSSQWMPSRGPSTYTDSEFPVSLTLPAGWSATRKESGEGDGRVVNVMFGDGTNGVTMVIAPNTLEPLIRQTSRGAALRVFENGDRVYVLNGQADFVDTLGASVTFID